MASVTFKGRRYTAERFGDDFTVSVQFRYHARGAAQLHQHEAYCWLGDHGLRRGKIRRLLEQLNEQVPA